MNRHMRLGARRGWCFAATAAGFAILLPLLAFGQAQPEYRFDRMWPTLQQPWYFDSPWGIAVDRTGAVYFSDYNNRRIQKLNADGYLLIRWGSEGTGPGQFGGPSWVAVDTDGYVYVVDVLNHRVEKFTSHGEFVCEWGGLGTGPGRFDQPSAVAVDPSGYVYVSDYNNDRIQKFTSDGEFVLAWGTYGAGPGQFDGPSAVATDSTGHVYVTDANNHRVEKFTSAGVFVRQWGSDGEAPGQFGFPMGITVDRWDFVYVSDTLNRRVQKFTRDGSFVLTWGAYGTDPGEFQSLVGIVTDSSGFVYVVDDYANRIQKFTPDGVFVTEWSSVGRRPGEFSNPAGLATDTSGSVYVADASNNRIQKFTSNGVFALEWGSQGSLPGQFILPFDVAVDNAGVVYVADMINGRIQKFNGAGVFQTMWGIPATYSAVSAVAVDNAGHIFAADAHNHCVWKFTTAGAYVTVWGGQGNGPGQLYKPYGIGVDVAGAVYVADTFNHRVQKFTGNGQLLLEWGGRGSEPGQLSYPRGIAFDAAGNAIVVDAGNARIQKFTPTGQFLMEWGGWGDSAGQFYNAFDVAVDTAGNAYVTDYDCNRVQKFRPVALAQNSKAVIVAGGGPFPGNNLWDATSLSANFAFRTLMYQGFTKETIYYLSSDTALDLDTNGWPDEVDAEVTAANLEHALTQWVPQSLGGLRTGDVVVYLVDHGGRQTFRLNETETLSARTLDAWLDRVQARVSGRVIVVLDACDSGTFHGVLKSSTSGRRILISSTSPGEPAYFLVLGSISFSSFFWTEIFNGLGVADAFAFAGTALGQAVGRQTPQLDANGDGLPNQSADWTAMTGVFIGNGTDLFEDRPVIGTVSPPQTISGTNAAILRASAVTDDDGIARVWAIIRPPVYGQDSPENPVVELPSVDMLPTGGDEYAGAYHAFHTTGTYQVAVYARDRIGNTSAPKLTTVSVNSPLRRRAVIVAGGAQTDAVWPAVEHNMLLAYEALTFQGYSNDDIYFLSPAAVSPGVDGTPVLSNVQYALTTWAANQTQDLVLYLVGDGSAGSFALGPGQNLTYAVLDTWLDSLQGVIPGIVAVICDAPRSGTALGALVPPAGKNRIVIAAAGANEGALFLSRGDVSFSQYFWTRVINGANVKAAFAHAQVALSVPGLTQNPMLDDNGNGVGNEKADGALARAFTIGAGIMLASDDPIIGTMCPEQTLNGQPGAALWVDDVTTTGTIVAVWAVITPPTVTTTGTVTELPSAFLHSVGGNRYEGAYAGFYVPGTYHITVFAKDAQGNVSLGKETVVRQLSPADLTWPDMYEDDDTPGDASWIGVNGLAQCHHFHDAGDVDYVRFYASGGTIYTLDTLNLGPNCDTVLTVFAPDGVTPLAQNDDFVGSESFLVWTAPSAGIYYAAVRHHNSATFGPGTQYQLRVWTEVGPTFPGTLMGVATDALTGAPIAGAHVAAAGMGKVDTITDHRGEYVFPALTAGIYSVSVDAAGYRPEPPRPVSVPAGGVAQQDFRMSPSTTVPAPANVSASDGVYPDKVRITWDAVGSGAEYQVYRAETNNPAVAVAISGWTAETSFDDTSALPPAAGSTGCGGSGVQYRYYWYWVKTWTSQGESGFSTADRGYRGQAKVGAVPGTSSASVTGFGTAGPPRGGDALITMAAILGVACARTRRQRCPRDSTDIDGKIRTRMDG